MNKIFKYLLTSTLVIVTLLFILNSSKELSEEVYQIEIKYDSINISPSFKTEFYVTLKISNSSIFLNKSLQEFENLKLIIEKDTINLLKLSQEKTIKKNSTTYINLKGEYINNKNSYYSDKLKQNVYQSFILNNNGKELKNYSAYIICTEKIHKFMNDKIHLIE